MNQKDIFIHSEGDAWFRRNRSSLESRFDFPDINFVAPYVTAVEDGVVVKFLEVGCGSGHRVNALQKVLKADGWGIDPSLEAIRYAKSVFAKCESGSLSFQNGTADNLSFSDSFFDFVYFGFCLYVVDRDLLNQVIFEANRVLKSGGKLAILDFDHPSKVNKNIHHPLLHTYKDTHERFFFQMGYESIGKLSLDHLGNVGFEPDPDLRIAVNLLWKPLR